MRRSSNDHGGPGDRGVRWLAVLCLLALPAIAPTAAQTSQPSPFEEYLELPKSATQREAPRLVFDLLTELALPGPLPGPGPRLVGERIEIAVAGGRALTEWTAGSRVQVEPLAVESDVAPPAAPEFVVAQDGKVRSAAFEDGFILTQKKCRRCDRGWRKRWKLRVPGSTFAPPLITDRLVYFGTSDNQVYAVKRKNGHRVWQRDVAGRVTRPLGYRTLERDRAEPQDGPPPPDLILVIPDGGAALLALDAETGARVAEYESPENESLVGGPLATPDGKVAVARQSYRSEEASLLVFDLIPAPSPEPSEEEAPGAPAPVAAARRGPDGL